jgi:hypothetical protein
LSTWEKVEKQKIRTERETISFLMNPPIVLIIPAEQRMAGEKVYTEWVSVLFLHYLLKRRGRDSNPGNQLPGSTVFETAPFNHSGTSPESKSYKINQGT